MVNGSEDNILYNPKKFPLIKKNMATGQMVAGFLNKETGIFTVDMDIDDEKDIDVFIEKYQLPVVMIARSELL